MSTRGVKSEVVVQVQVPTSDTGVTDLTAAQVVARIFDSVPAEPWLGRLVEMVEQWGRQRAGHVRLYYRAVCSRCGACCEHKLIATAPREQQQCVNCRHVSNCAPRPPTEEAAELARLRLEVAALRARVEAAESALAQASTPKPKRKRANRKDR